MRTTHFHVVSYCNGVLVGTSVSTSADCFIRHLMAIHDKTTNVEMTVYPYDCQGHHLRVQGGQLYPLFLYRSAVEAKLSRDEFYVRVHDYAYGLVDRPCAAQLQPA